MSLNNTHFMLVICPVKKKSQPHAQALINYKIKIIATYQMYANHKLEKLFRFRFNDKTSHSVEYIYELNDHLMNTCIVYFVCIVCVLVCDDGEKVHRIAISSLHLNLTAKYCYSNCAMCMACTIDSNHYQNQIYDNFFFVATERQ